MKNTKQVSLSITMIVLMTALLILAGFQKQTISSKHAANKNVDLPETP
ncbi:MAG: hypothetical protein GY754_14500 [bacterium]|nr:hypothetical protein [bacterium]